MPGLEPDRATAEQNMKTARSLFEPVDAYMEALLGAVDFSVTLPFGGTQTTFSIEDSLPELQKALACAVKHHWRYWAGGSSTSARDGLKDDVFGCYVDTAASFVQTADKLDSLIGEIDDEDATAEQIASARRDFGVLVGQVKASNVRVVSAHDRLTEYSTIAMDDLRKLTVGESSIRHARVVLGDWLTKNSMVADAADAKLYRDYYDVQTTFLDQLESRVTGSLENADGAAQAVLQLREQFSTLQAMAEDSLRNLDEASSGDLAEIVTELDLRTARSEWELVGKLAGEILASIPTGLSTFGLLPPGDDACD